MKVIIKILSFILLFSSGCTGTGNLSDRSQEADEAPADFKATGNEPSWGLEIEFGKEINFSSLTEEYKSFTTSLSEPERYTTKTGGHVDSLRFERPAVRPEGINSFTARQGAEETGTIQVTRYTSDLSNGTMEINILRLGCIDDMSGDRFPFSVIVEITDTINQKTGSFKGCGQFSGSYSLNDIWKLDMINGKKISIPVNRQFPTLEIDIEGKSVAGYGGCNQFQGRAEVVDDRLVTGNIRSTKMACPDTQDIENVFLRTISGKVLNFASSGSTMVITDQQNELKFIRKR